MKKYLVSVYGSLRNKQSNYEYYLSSSIYKGTFSTEPEYTLHSLSFYPGLKLNGTTSIVMEVYEVDENTLSSSDFNAESKTFVIFPNPSSNSELVYFNRMADIELYDVTGKLILSEKEALTINTSKLVSGIYFVKTSEGITKKLVVK